MNDIVKFALSCLKMYAASILIALLFMNLALADTIGFRIFGVAATLLVMVALAFFEGGSRGETDAQFTRIIENRQKERGIDPTTEELQKVYKPWKGFVCGALSVSPVILMSLIMLVAPLFVTLSKESFFWGTPVIRVMLFPFIGMIPVDPAQTWVYPLMSIVFPAIIGVAYLMGPRRFSKLVKQMHENEMRRKRRKKKKSAPR